MKSQMNRLLNEYKDLGHSNQHKENVEITEAFLDTMNGRGDTLAESVNEASANSANTIDITHLQNIQNQLPVPKGTGL